MSSNKSVVPSAREALNKFKMEAANEVGVNLKQGYNGDLTSKQAGSVGGQMESLGVEEVCIDRMSAKGAGPDNNRQALPHGMTQK